MPLASSGTMSIGGSTTDRSINLELGRSATATSSLNESALRTLAGKASGAIALSDFYGKSNLSVTLPNYNAGAQNIVLARTYTANPPVNDFVTCFVRLKLNSDGTGAYTYEDYGSSEANFTTFTWLTSGSASDCYAYMDAPTGDAFFAGTTGSSLQLNTNRTWSLRARAPLNNNEQKFLTSTIRIKNVGGTDLVAKTLYMEANVYNE